MRIFVDTRDRLSFSASSTDFTVPLPSPLTRVSAVTLVDAMIPNTLYNIDSSNNALGFKVGATSFTATLIPGNYTPATLVTEIANQMNTVASGSGVTFAAAVNDTTFKITISGTGGTFQLLFSSATSPWRELGFSNADTGVGSSFTGSNAAQLDMPQHLFLGIRELGGTSNYISTTSASNATFYAPIYSNGGDISIYLNSQFPQRLVFCPALPALAMLTVRLMDKNGTVRNLNNANWSFILDVEISE